MLCRLTTPLLLITPSLGFRGKHLGTRHKPLDGVTGNITLDAEKEMNDRIDVKIPITTLQASNSLLTYQLKSSLFLMLNTIPILRSPAVGLWRWGWGTSGFLVHCR